MRRFVSDIVWLLAVHLTGLLAMSVFRTALYVVGHQFLADTSRGDMLLQAGAFLRGVWFDNVTACYIMILPLVLVVLWNALNIKIKKGNAPYRYFIWVWLTFFYAIAMAVSAADIPYFLYFFKHINSGIWNWAEYGATTAGMMLGEPMYYPPLIGWVLMVCLFCRQIRPNGWMANIVRMDERRLRPLGIGAVILMGCALIGLCLFGIRGRRGYNPIKVSAAYYCQDTFLNQLGVNPAFNLLATTLDSRRPENRELQLMNEHEARSAARQYMHRPLAYTLQPSDSALFQGKPNVVLILMESMSSELMGKGLTPFLDSLAQQSIRFNNCYSAGNHTNHGIFSTLYSYPALMFRNLMKGSNIPRYHGLPTVLQAEGYRTLFFMTHEAQYDNMNAFLRTNGYDEIYAQENYPKEKVANSFGVQDDFLYEYAIGRLADVKEPFFATLLSISNHPPYVIPDWFHPTSEEDEDAIVEYADHALKEFFCEAKRQPWYANTVFVLLGDHGKLCIEPENEMPQCMNHVPWIIYKGGLVPQSVDGWTMQMDVQPTLLSLMGVGAKQEHMGQDVLNLPRRMAIYTADNVLGARTEKHLYIYEPGTKSEWLYCINDSTGEYTLADTAEVENQVAKGSMQHELFSILQTAQGEIKKHEQGQENSW